MAKKIKLDNKIVELMNQKNVRLKFRKSCFLILNLNNN